jgi:hypothetical protein
VALSDLTPTAHPLRPQHRRREDDEVIIKRNSSNKGRKGKITACY